MRHDIILETERLIIREHVLSDAPFFFTLNSNYNVVKYTGDSSFETIDEAEKIVQYVMNQYKENGYGRWLVSEKETNNPIGWCGLKFHTDTEETDIGYRLLESAWGKGYATESAKACLDYGFKHFNLNRIIGEAMQENTASINVFKKLGMTYLKDSLIDNVESVVYELKKENHK
jgi:[ribosomal protein S5]-alanine N-acetyltransferase